MSRAFSLVELSIVLVILGLLTGGILAGQSLIRAAELRSITTEYNRYVTAIQTFRDKYLAQPGDMPNATRFWSRLQNTADCTSASASTVGSPGTCDGNGNALIEYGPNASESNEVFQSWRQLALAGIIEGSYSGIAGSGSRSHHIAGTNSPVSKMSRTSWELRYLGPISASAELFASDYGTLLTVGAIRANTGPIDPILKPEEAWNIDTKIDDGRPAYGRVIARYWNNLCASADDGSSADNDLQASYRLTDTSLQCALHFRIF